jgi:hypothetical protein
MCLDWDFASASRSPQALAGFIGADDEGAEHADQARSCRDVRVQRSSRPHALKGRARERPDVTERSARRSLNVLTFDKLPLPLQALLPLAASSRCVLPANVSHDHSLLSNYWNLP